MIPRNLSGTFVCLRCQLQRASPSNRRQFLRLSPGASSSAATTRRFATNAASIRGEEPEADVEIDWGKFADIEEIDADAAGQELAVEKKQEVHEFLRKDSLARRVFQAGGERLLQGEEKISIDVLGQAAHAIILRRGGKWERRGKRAIVESPEAIQQVDIAGTLERENADPDLAEILKNIHELQPLNNKVLPDVEVEALKLVLTRGFTKQQLRSYIHYTRTTVDFDKGGRPPWILHQSLWKQKQQEAEGGPVERPTDAIQDISKKEKLVDRLIDECWGLVAESKQDRQGYVDVTLRDVEFGLLIVGNKRWLNQTARHFKDFPRQIELYPSTKVLRIVASKVVAEAMLEEINDILKLKKTVSHDLDLVSAEPLSQAVLEQVGQITNSVIQLEPGGKKITMAWIHNIGHDEFEDLGDVVLRFLLSSFGPRRRGTSILTAQPPSSLEKGRYITDYDSAARLPWKERQRNWARWISARTKKASSQEGDEVPANVLQQLVEFEKKFAKHAIPEPIVQTTSESPESPESSTTTRPVWSLQPLASTHAVFGHVLHSPNLASHILQTRTTKLNKSFDRSFMPVVPPLAGLQFFKHDQRDRPRHSTLVLHFLPAPDQDFALSHASPPLELRLEMDGNELHQILSLRAIVDNFAANVLYPQRPVDMRITQQRFYEISGSKMESSQAYAVPVLDFINASTLEVESGTLRTPPQLLGLQVPRRLLRPKRRSWIPGEGNDDAVDFVKVNYRFSGLEIHRAVAAEYEGYTLSYRQVEAGQRGGNWSELALHDAKPVDYYPASDAVQPSQCQAVPFLTAVSSLVSKQENFKWPEDRISS